MIEAIADSGLGREVDEARDLVFSNDLPELVGPFVREMACTLGLECSVSLSGYRLNATNKLVALSSGECGDANATYANETWGIVNATNVSGNATQTSFGFGTPTVASRPRGA